MSADTFDIDFVEDVIARVRCVTVTSRPRWGRMKSHELVPHFIGDLRYSMGRLHARAIPGSWVSSHLLGPLVLYGVLPLSKTHRACAPSNDANVSNDVETLHALLEEYVALVQADELIPEPHPYFGDIGVDGWARFHVLHFEHHLRQFGV